MKEKKTSTLLGIVAFSCRVPSISITPINKNLLLFLRNLGTQDKENTHDDSDKKTHAR